MALPSVGRARNTRSDGGEGGPAELVGEREQETQETKAKGQWIMILFA